MPTRKRRTRPVDDTFAESAGAGATATGVVVALVGAAVVTYLFLTNSDPKSFEAYRFINCGLCLWVPLMVILFVLGRQPADFGLGLGDRKLGLRWALLLWLGMLVFIFFAAHRPEFRNAYANNYLRQWMPGLGQPWDMAYSNATHSAVPHINPKALLFYELSMGFYMFAWEFFFRGFLLFGLEQTKLRPVGAVILQAIPFVLLHWSPSPGASKPWLEVIGALPAALILGALAIKTRSMIYGFACHWAVSVTFDLVMLAPFIIRQYG